MRADKFFAEKFGSRSKAQDVLKRGLILRNGKILSPSDEVSPADSFTFLDSPRFVSQGGYKLERAFLAFHESPSGETFADLGASTGGFCDCLLRFGASHVFCVDVGENQLEPALQADPRVTVMDNRNARFLTPADFPCTLDGIVGDLSFISLRLILPVVYSLLPQNGRAFLLFKPQFECGRSLSSKSGICPLRLHPALLAEFYDFCKALSFIPQNIVNAPVRPKKNIEYLLFFVKGKDGLSKAEFLSRAEKISEN